MRYRLILERDDNDTVLATSPDFPLVTYGSDETEARRNATDAAEHLLQSMIDAREPLPPSDEGTAAGSMVHFSVQTKLKCALYGTLHAEGLTRADLQRRLKWNRESVARLFRLDHNSKIEQIDRAFAALGKGVELGIVDDPAARAA